MCSTDNELSIFNKLPNELRVKICQYLPVDDLARCMRVCTTWNAWLHESHYLWALKQKQLCLTPKSMQLPHQTDEESQMDKFMRLYRESLVKRNWLSGRMDKISSYNDLPSNYICPMNVEVWGEILDQELLR